MAAPRRRTGQDETKSMLLELVRQRLEPLGWRIVQRMQDEMPAYAELSVDELLPAALLNIQLMLPAMSSSRSFTDAEVAAFVEHGEARARRGIAIEELLRGWRLGTRALVDEMLDLARQETLDEGIVLELTRNVLAASDVAMVFAARGHRNAELLWDRAEQQRRVDLLRSILSGAINTAQVREDMEAQGLDPDARYLAIRACPTPEMPADSVERLLSVGPWRHAPRGLTAMIDGDVCGFVDHVPADTTEVSVGVGPPTLLDGLPTSFRIASRAAATAAAFGLSGVHSLDQLGLLPAVLADDEVGDEMVRRYVAPLDDGQGGPDVLETVRQYLANHMKVDVTASALFVHENTVRYRLRRFEDITGADLRDPSSAIEVWWGLQRSRIATGRT